MEFRFDVGPLLKAHIVRITSNLIPQGFTGDRRSALDAVSKISEIINELGEASARAQGLNKPVTTAQKLRNSDHIVYLLTEKTGKNGSVTGLLKIGTKNLYVFDENGETQLVPAPCVLDFYIHESRQRAGLGKALFEHMLERENLVPHKMAIDRPSEKLVAFYRKHYGLERTIPQMNNFVVYDGFFDKPQSQNGTGTENGERRMHITASPNTALFGPQFKSDEYVRRTVSQQQSSSNFIAAQNAPMGRFGAKRPTCSMAEIIHSTPTSITSEPHSRPSQFWDVPEAAGNNKDVLSETPSEHSHILDDVNEIAEAEPLQIDYDKSVEDIIADIENVNMNAADGETVLQKPHYDMAAATTKEVKFNENNIIDADGLHKKPSRFQHTKQHTGLKNISFNVGAAVSPTDKMEFDQEAPESFGVVKINRPIGKSSTNVDNTDAMSTISSMNSEGLTEQGYFDLKFYHNRLW